MAQVKIITKKINILFFPKFEFPVTRLIFQPIYRYFYCPFKNANLQVEPSTFPFKEAKMQVSSLSLLLLLKASKMSFAGGFSCYCAGKTVHFTYSASFKPIYLGRYRFLPLVIPFNLSIMSALQHAWFLKYCQSQSDFRHYILTEIFSSGRIGSEKLWRRFTYLYTELYLGYMAGKYRHFIYLFTYPKSIK